MRKPGESVYCLSFWRNKFHGKSGDEPYFDVAEDGISAGKVMRIYVDAKRFPTWEKWKDEADKARACAYIGNASMCGYFVKGGTSYPLSASPAFMIERPELPGLDTILWINVVCPNESEFHWAVEEAKKTAELKAKNLAPSELYAPFNNVQYRHREAAESDIDAFLRRNGITPATAESDGTYDGTYGRKIYGPIPDDIKALLKKIGLGASECGNTLGELFQKWGSSNVEVLPSPQSEACYKKAAGQDRRHSDLSISAA